MATHGITADQARTTFRQRPAETVADAEQLAHDIITEHIPTTDQTDPEATWNPDPLPPAGGGCRGGELDARNLSGRECPPIGALCERSNQFAPGAVHRIDQRLGDCEVELAIIAWPALWSRRWSGR